MRLILTLAVALSPSFLAAQDRCLTARDLGRGVAVMFENGDRQTLRRIGDGSIERIEFAEGRTPTRFRGPFGLYVVEEVALENGKPVASDLLTIAFADPLKDLPAPASGVTWQGKTTNIFADGSQREEEFSVVVGAPTSLFLSGCNYEVLPITVRYAWPEDGGWLELTYDYFPALGAGYLLTSQMRGEGPASSPASGIALLSK